MSLKLSGTTIIIGAGPASNAYIFTGSGSTWTQQTILTQDGNFGTSVAINGTTAVVGAPFGSSSNQDGLAYVFSGSGSSWTPQYTLSAPDASGQGDQFGTSVAIAGSWVVVGATYYNNADGYQPGRVYIFQGSSLVQELESEPGNDDNSDNYGQSVAGTQGMVIGGAPQFDNANGAAIIYSAPASLSISATHGTPVFRSGPVNLSLAVANAGVATAAVATVSDTVPSDLTINAAPGCSIAGQTVTCTLAAGATGTNTYNVYTTASAAAASSLSNTATLTDTTDTVSTGSSTDNISVGSQAPLADSSFSQMSISGSTNGGSCASGNHTLTATVQLENMTGSTLTNPYAVNVTVSGGNTLISNTSNAATVAASGVITYTFDIQLATCNTFHPGFDVRSN